MSKKQKQKFPYLVGSKWTAKQKNWGWRHFQVINRKNQGRWIFAEMAGQTHLNSITLVRQDFQFLAIKLNNS